MIVDIVWYLVYVGLYNYIVYTGLQNRKEQNRTFI